MGKPLSPAAQAVLDAIGIPVGSSLFPAACGFSALALRALADHQIPITLDGPACHWTPTPHTRSELRNIADELDGICGAEGGTDDEIHLRGLKAVRALTQSEPEGPTDEELISPIMWMIDECVYDNDKGEIAQSLRELITRFGHPAVLARWSHPAIEPDGPAVPDGREPASVAYQPTDQELLELMPETMRDEFSYAATVCSDATGGQVKPGIFRVCLNHSALEYARAAIAADRARYARPAIEPVPVSERPWEREGWCDAEGRCWMVNELLEWAFRKQYKSLDSYYFHGYTHLLPHWALPVPSSPTPETP